MMEYITRAIVLNAKVDPKEKDNEGEREQLWMEVIQTMLEEAVTLPSDSEESKSLECLRTVLKKVNFLSEPKKFEEAPELFYSLQIVSWPREVSKERDTNKHGPDSVCPRLLSTRKSLRLVDATTMTWKLSTPLNKEC